MDSRRNLQPSPDRLSGMNDEYEEQKRTQMFKLSQIIKTLEDFKAIKGQVTMTSKLVQDID